MSANVDGEKDTEPMRVTRRRIKIDLTRGTSRGSTPKSDILLRSDR